MNESIQPANSSLQAMRAEYDIVLVVVKYTVQNFNSGTKTAAT